MNWSTKSILALVLCAASAHAGDQDRLAADVLSKEQRPLARSMIERDIRARTTEVNARDRDAWSRIKTREDWEKFRDERIERLRRSLGPFPAPPTKPTFRITGTIKGDGFRIDNILYESRPGQWVPGNLYVPAQPTKSMPGILIAHAHHRDRTQSELQDMGMTWARAGCVVLVIDQVGYGERRTHPFRRAEDYARPYRVDRQDYFFRYDTGVQLQLLGDSLMGWMVRDLMRGIDVVLAQDGVDPARVILLGAVAGGGDPAGVMAALDRRVACCVPFNFGGPQPETRYPLPDDAETSFNYLSGSYWDSTRGLRLGGRDDFLHWVIVASIAPRRLIHAHEFAWDGERDPVWRRYRKIWGDLYGAGENLGVAHGKGLLRGQPPEASHCTNIGRIHRRMIHPLFERWFGIRVSEKDEYSAPRKPVELMSLTGSLRQELKPRSFRQLTEEMARERLQIARERLAKLEPKERARTLRKNLGELLGPVAPQQAAAVLSRTVETVTFPGATVERIVVEVEPGMLVPVVLLAPKAAKGRAPAVVGVARAGKAAFLKQRADDLQKMIAAGTIVVLPDVRGTGESSSGADSGRTSRDTDISVNLQVFGETLLGQRLRDLRSVLGYLRQRPDVDTTRIALWGESFTSTNPPDTDFKVPHGVDGTLRMSEPLGGLLALLGGLFEDEVGAIHISGSLVSYESVLQHFAVLVPHGDTLPGVLAVGDLCDIAAALAPRPLRMTAMVDQLNQRLAVADARRNYAATASAYEMGGGRFDLAEGRHSVAEWLLEHLRTKR